MRYDPAVAPNAARWLNLDEAERIAIVERFHRGTSLPNARAHAAIHVAVETQLAIELPAVVQALRRLQNEGLDRHEAIHAVGAVLTEHLLALMRDEAAPGDPNGAYFAALERITVERWRREFGGAADDV